MRRRLLLVLAAALALGFGLAVALVTTRTLPTGTLETEVTDVTVVAPPPTTAPPPQTTAPPPPPKPKPEVAMSENYNRFDLCQKGQNRELVVCPRGQWKTTCTPRRVA